MNAENENRNNSAGTPGSEASPTGIPNSELGTQNCPAAPEPSTADPTGCPFLPPPPRRRGPASKVAGLPLYVQAFVNEQILNGLSFQHVCDQLAEKGHPGFTVPCLARWSNGGFRDWAMA